MDHHPEDAEEWAKGFQQQDHSRLATLNELAEEPFVMFRSNAEVANDCIDLKLALIFHPRGVPESDAGEISKALHEAYRESPNTHGSRRSTSRTFIPGLVSAGFTANPNRGVVYQYGSDTAGEAMQTELFNKMMDIDNKFVEYGKYAPCACCYILAGCMHACCFIVVCKIHVLALCCGYDVTLHWCSMVRRKAFGEVAMQLLLDEVKELYSRPLVTEAERSTEPTRTKLVDCSKHPPALPGSRCTAMHWTLDAEVTPHRDKNDVGWSHIGWFQESRWYRHICMQFHGMLVTPAHMLIDHPLSPAYLPTHPLACSFTHPPSRLPTCMIIHTPTFPPALLPAHLPTLPQCAHHSAMGCTAHPWAMGCATHSHGLRSTQPWAAQHTAMSCTAHSTPPWAAQHTAMGCVAHSNELHSTQHTAMG